MLFSDRPRTLYRNRPAHEVICQLRFPSILSINQVEPAEFPRGYPGRLSPICPAPGPAAHRRRPDSASPSHQLPLSL